MTDRNYSKSLLNKYVKTENLRLHCEMVAIAMEGYAGRLNKTENETDRWWTAGLLHDLDWELYPDQHPHKAVDEILPENGYDVEIIEAITTHAPDRTGKEPKKEIERFLFACDEISGFMNAVAIMRPNGFTDMKVKSVTKKLKDKRFAKNVPREEIHKGADLISLPLKEHIQNMIDIFKKTYG